MTTTHTALTMALQGMSMGGHESSVGPSGDLHNQSGQTESPEKKESTPEQGEHKPAGTTEQGGVSGTPAVPPSGVTEEHNEHTES